MNDICPPGTFIASNLFFFFNIDCSRPADNMLIIDHCKQHKHVIIKNQPISIYQVEVLKTGKKIHVL